jgi:MFS family permease
MELMTPPSPSLASVAYRRGALMATLFAAQVCASTGFTMSLAVGSIMAAAITGTNTWSGLPVALGALGGALASWPLARLMDRFGRRPGLGLGYLLAVGGAALGMLAVLNGSFALFLIGMALFGIANASNMLARYAAADISVGPQRGRAMGLIVWGSTVGSIIGPNLMDPAVRVGATVGVAAVASPFLISLAGYSLAAVLVQTLLRPDPLAIARERERPLATSSSRRRRPIGEIVGEPRVALAFVTLMMSQLVMIGTTSTSTLYLHDQGHSVGTIGLAASLHLAGMYVSSPLSGWLCDRFGRLPMIGVGGVILLFACALAGLVPGSASGLVIAGLFLNGIGWNLAFVSASALLTDALSPDDRTSIQGLADLFMGLMGAVGSAVGGVVLGAWGFGMLNALGAAMLILPLAAGSMRRAAAAARAAEPDPWAP